MDNYSDDNFELAECPICSGDTRWVDCDHCDGAGGFHNCGECTCVCADQETLDDMCPACKWHGGYLECASLPHTDEQMAAWRTRKEIKTK